MAYHRNDFTLHPFELATFGDVAGDRRSARDLAAGVLEWRNGDGHIEAPTTFGDPHCLVRLNPLTSFYPIEKALNFLMTLCWHEE